MTPQGVWRCVAGNTTHAYAVDSLDRAEPTFALQIYDGPHIDPQRWRETVLMQVQPVALGLRASGERQTGTPVVVRAFEQSIEFVVHEPNQAPAVGNCSYLTDWQ